MTPEQFVYWLQGFVEISKPEKYSGDFQHAWLEIKNHLDLVLTKKTPTLGVGSLDVDHTIKDTKAVPQKAWLDPTRFSTVVTC